MARYGILSNLICSKLSDLVRILDPNPPSLFYWFSGREPLYFIGNKEKTLRASYDRDTQIIEDMD
jgi:hypothetical protein